MENKVLLTEKIRNSILSLSNRTNVPENDTFLYHSSRHEQKCILQEKKKKIRTKYAD